MSDTAQHAKETGRRIMNELMGDGYVETKDRRKNAFNAVLHAYSEEVCFGRIWARDGLARKTRSMLNIAMLTALGRPNQLRHHVEGALNHGVTVGELREILLQTAVYCGLPAAGDAFKIAEEVLKTRGLVDEGLFQA